MFTAMRFPFGPLLLLTLCSVAPGVRADVPVLFRPGGLSYGSLQPMPRFGSTAMPALSPGRQCRQAVRNAGRVAGIPDHLMSAIARVESGRTDLQGEVNPWPWSINVEGVDHIYDTKPEVIAAVQGFQARGVRSIDVGCMQVNLMYHPEAFASLEQAFDPAANATYAAHFLQQLFAQTGSWPAATAAYHSAAPDLGGPYQRKVQSVLAEEQRRDDAMGSAPAMTAMNTVRPMPAGNAPLTGSAPTPAGPMPAGPGAIMLGNHAQAARLLPMVPGSSGRGLDAYRAAPVLIASQPLIRMIR